MYCVVSLSKKLYYVPKFKEGWGGHIGFGVDPVGVGIHEALFP